MRLIIRNYPLKTALVSSSKKGTPTLRKYYSDDTSSKKGDTEEDVTTIELEEGDEELDTKSSGTLMKAAVPDFFPELLAVPVSRRPIFPGFYKTISVKDAKVAEKLHQLMKKGRPYIGLFLAKDHSPSLTEEGGIERAEFKESDDTIHSLSDVHDIGVLAQVINVIPMPSDGVTAIVYPHRRIRATELLSSAKESTADAGSGAGAEDSKCSYIRPENIVDSPYDKKNRVVRAISQEIFGVLSDVAKLNSFFREHIAHHNVPASVFEDPSRLADFVAVLSSCEPLELQELLAETVVEERLKKALILLKKELVTAQLQHAISKEVEQKLSQKQREYFLHEQLKAIKKELGLETDTKEKLIDTFNQRLAKLKLPETVQKVYDEEVAKLAVLEPAGAEFNVTRNYLDWITQLPWGKHSEESLNVESAANVLNHDHWGLQDVKERILEFIAVGKLKGTVSGKIICLVGPPGVGKTSIGKSIARAIQREYYRFSVGGLSDVSEIKGHRRTYVGAMPGKIVQALKKVQTENPLILIDEIDKLGKGPQGDPASALLEMLDPEQNEAFMDHYLDVPLDLSRVLFMCTANQIDTIPKPLLDRMEVIEVSGYVAQEKKEIAHRHLIPQAMISTGLTSGQVEIKASAIDSLIKHYCRESGVRSLKKAIEKILRKVAHRHVKREIDSLPAAEGEVKEFKKYEITGDNIIEYMGNPIFTSERLYEGNVLPRGVSTGLAWTSMGGTILYIETIVEGLSSRSNKPGKVSDGAAANELIRTGQLSDVMKESSSIAYSYAKSFMTEHYPDNDFFTTARIHLHVPDGATPKDGPSAGCTMTTALLSQALHKPISANIAMTGEISLTGKILRIGGVKEKTISAQRSGINQIILPESNRSDWNDLPDYIRENMQPHFVQHYSEIAKILGFL